LIQSGVFDYCGGHGIDVNMESNPDRGFTEDSLNRFEDVEANGNGGNGVDLESSGEPPPSGQPAPDSEVDGLEANDNEKYGFRNSWEWNPPMPPEPPGLQVNDANASANGQAGFKLLEAFNDRPLTIAGTGGGDAPAITLSGSDLSENHGPGLLVEQRLPLTTLAPFVLASGSEIEVSGISIYDNAGPGIEVIQTTLNPAGATEVIGTLVQLGPGGPPNSIWGNGGPAIDLNGDGPTANDALDADVGANGLTNYPVLTDASAGNSTIVNGSYDGAPNTAILVRFYSNVACNSERGPGEHFLGSQDYVTDGTGHADINAVFDGDAIGAFIAATATGPEGTSEFSPCIEGTGLGGRLGDTDCDDDADPADAIASLLELSGGEAVPCAWVGDVNCDGERDVTDVVELLARVADLRRFRPGCGPIG
jgi:hypothetical protein